MGWAQARLHNTTTNYNKTMMKTSKMIVGCLGILALSATLTACSDDDNDSPVTPPDSSVSYVWGTDGGFKSCDHVLFDAEGKEAPEGKVIGNGDQNFVFKGQQTLAKGTYLLRGWVYVASGSTLTIPAGTIVKGDKETKAAIIVEPGGKLIAKGTATEPIVFTSEQAPSSRRPWRLGWCDRLWQGSQQQWRARPADRGRSAYEAWWHRRQRQLGCVAVCPHRVCWLSLQEGWEINGLTLGSVGAGTTVDHVQVSYSNDDSFEWFGGTVNCKYLIAYRGWDDDFDTDNGYSGNVQFGLSVRDSRIADASQSNGFESDNNAEGSTAEPFTSATFSNMTFLGPKVFDANFQNTTDYLDGGKMNPGNGSSTGRFHRQGMHLRRNTRLNCYNSVVAGWPIGLILDSEKGNTQKAATDGLLQLHRIVFAGTDVTGSDFNKVYKDELYDYKTKTTDPSKKSFSSTFFLLPPTATRLLINGWHALGRAFSPSLLPAPRWVALSRDRLPNSSPTTGLTSLLLS